MNLSAAKSVGGHRPRGVAHSGGLSSSSGKKALCKNQAIQKLKEEQVLGVCNWKMPGRTPGWDRFDDLLYRGFV